MNETFTRSCQVTLKFITASKKRKIDALLESYRSAVNFYIRSLWNKRGSLNKETFERLKSSRLSQRYRSSAQKQALEIVVSTKKSLKANKKFGNVPIFKGSAILDAKFIDISERKNKELNLCIRLSTLAKGKRINILTKKTKVLDKWLSFPNSKMIQGCALSENRIILFIRIPQTTKSEGDALGIDMGVNKLLSDSNGNHYGTEFKTLRDKILRKKQGSKAKKRALKERDNFIGREINKLPWDKISLLAIEDLKNIKFGKKKNRSKTFRKAIVPWTVRQVVSRIENKSQENRVCLVKVNPQNTSRTCPCCGVINIESRKGEIFHCITCGHQNDADTNGAINILNKALLGIQSSQSYKRFNI